MPGRYSVTNTHAYIFSHRDVGGLLLSPAYRDVTAQKQTLPTQGPKAGKWQSWDLNAASLCPEPQNCTISQERSHFLARENATCSSLTSQELAQDEFPAVHAQSLLSLLSCLIAPTHHHHHRHRLSKRSCSPQDTRQER